MNAIDDSLATRRAPRWRGWRVSLALLLSCAAIISVAVRPASAQRAPQDGVSARSDPAWAPQLDQLIDSLARTGRAGAVAISVRGTTRYSRGFGESIRSSHRPNTANTLFDLGSIPKSFTAVAIFLLRDAGRLRLTDSLHRFFPSAPADKRALTVWQLLTHSSGLQLYIDTTGGDLERLSRDSALVLAFAQPLRFTPGSREAYSNTGYIVLAALIERACACRYERYVHDHILAPARMAHTEFWGSPRMKRRGVSVAMGYVADTLMGSPRQWPRTWAALGANGLASTTLDLIRFSEWLHGGNGLALASQRQMYETPFNRYAAGWDAYRTDSGAVVVKGGSGNFGFHSQLRRHLPEGVTIALLFNAVPTDEDQPHQEFGPRISEIVLGRHFAH